MHESSNQRVADIALKADRNDERMPDHLENLPEETHIITGKLEADGAHALASEKAHLSAKVVYLERTPSGGIDYQLAIFVSEPEPELPEEVKLPLPANVVEAMKYFTDKGMSEEMAKNQVDHFGADRVVAQRNKELDDELASFATPKAKELEPPKV